jgi:hypothetical protein
MKALIIGVLCVLGPSLAAADILEWQDAQGITHYTNLKGEVPKAERDSVHVVVDEQARQPDPGAAAADPAVPAAPEPRREAEVVYDHSQDSEAYIEGLLRGLEAARGATHVEGGSVQINGPLAVARSESPASYPFYSPYYSPLVTTSFDRGRSRHLTLRMLLQDQFALDREGPFFVEQRLAPPSLGVGLNPFLPRGLPHHFNREARVIVR